MRRCASFEAPQPPHIDAIGNQPGANRVSNRVFSDRPPKNGFTAEAGDRAKLHARIDEDIQDSQIRRWIAAAVMYCENLIRKSFVMQTWRLTLDSWPYSCYPSMSSNPLRSILLPRPPLVSVTSVKYLDGSGIQQTWAPTSYRVDTDSEPGRITPVFGQTYPPAQYTTGAIEIVYIAGGVAANASPSLVQAVCLIVDHWNENRGMAAEGTVQTEIAAGVTNLLATEHTGDLLVI